MEKHRLKITRLSDHDPQDNYVPGTMASRIALVWPLTREAAALSGYDVDRPLQREVVVLRRLGR